MLLWHWSLILFAALYQHVIYPRRLRRRYDPHYAPHCTVVIPCKGASRHSRRNLLAYLQQDYPRYDVVFSVEAEDDPAVAIIERLVAQSGGAKLVVAGLASACAQKVHNLLAGIRHAGSSQLIVFADSDVAPAPLWLRQLVLPLSDPTVSITTSFRWLAAPSAPLGGLAHSYANMLIYVMFSTTAHWMGIGLWGGAIAMRKKEFDAFGVPSRWSECVVDDISLSQIAWRRRLKSVLVPLSITPSSQVLGTFDEATNWVLRQILYVKAYHPRLWLVCALLALAISLIYTLFPISLLGALLTRLSFWEWGGGVSLMLFAGEVLAVPMYALLGPIPNPCRMALLTPVLRLGQAIAGLRTIHTRTITWSGVRYTFDRNGRVVRVER
jgi:hypothetical protein